MSNMWTAYAAGASLYLGLILMGAGILKLVSIRAFATLLERLIPRTFWRKPIVTPGAVARLLVATEVLTGVALVVVKGRFAFLPAVFSMWLLLAFIGAIAIAMHKGVSCGCFGAFSKGPAGGAELGRGVVLALAAVALAFDRRGNGSAAYLPSTATVLVFLVLLGITVLGTTLGARLHQAAIARHRLRALTTEGAQLPPVTTLTASAPGLRPNGRKAAPQSRRSFLGILATAALGAVGLSSVTARPRKAAAAQTGPVFLEPQFFAINPGDTINMRVSYDTAFPDGALITRDFGDGTSDSGFALGHSVDFAHVYTNELHVFHSATVSGVGVETGQALISFFRATDCFGPLKDCDACCGLFNTPCLSCCSSCFDGCVSGFPCFPFFDCAGCSR